ncbi:unnamed protein product [Parajaminaea phylloscopi]
MAAAKATSSSSSSTDFVPTFSAGDYVRFFGAGALCATFTHGAMTPFDVVKTRIQLEPKGSADASMLKMTRKIIASEGAAGLLTGFGPTAVGYLIQGGAKFAGFEYFKSRFARSAGSLETAQKYRMAIYIGGASAAELIASTLLTPLEAARIRLVSERGYAKGLVGAVTRMASEGGLREFYAGYAPILCKQIPYAIGQFMTNEALLEVVQKNAFLNDLGKSGKAGQVTVQLGCGLGAGVAAAILSHPADYLLSKINQGGGGKGSAMSKLITLAKEAGPTGVWAGLGTRILMTAALVGGQFVIFKQAAIALGAPPGVSIATGTKSDH